MAFTDALTRKYGPLPVWAWGLLGGGAVVLLLRRQKGTKASVQQPVGLAGLDSTSLGGGGGGGGGTIGGAGPTGPTGPQGPPGPAGGGGNSTGLDWVPVLWGDTPQLFIRQKVDLLIAGIQSGAVPGWQFMGIENGQYRFRPVQAPGSSAGGPPPRRPPWQWPPTPTPPTGGDVGVAQLAGATAAGPNDSPLSPFAVVNALTGRGWVAPFTPPASTYPPVPAMRTQRIPGVSTPAIGVQAMRFVPPRMPARTEDRNIALQQTVAPVRTKAS
jgi:hypothetical protein